MVTDEDFVASEFEPSIFTESMHNMPRFGHTDDIGYAASSNLDVKEDYLLGENSANVDSGLVNRRTAKFISSAFFLMYV